MVKRADSIAIDNYIRHSLNKNPEKTLQEIADDISKMFHPITRQGVHLRCKNMNLVKNELNRRTKKVPKVFEENAIIGQIYEDTSRQVKEAQAKVRATITNHLNYKNWSKKAMAKLNQEIRELEEELAKVKKAK